MSIWCRAARFRSRPKPCYRGDSDARDRLFSVDFSIMNIRQSLAAVSSGLVSDAGQLGRVNRGATLADGEREFVAFSNAELWPLGRKRNDARGISVRGLGCVFHNVQCVTSVQTGRCCPNASIILGQNVRLDGRVRTRTRRCGAVGALAGPRLPSSPFGQPVATAPLAAAKGRWIARRTVRSIAPPTQRPGQACARGCWELRFRRSADPATPMLCVPPGAELSRRPFRSLAADQVG